MANNWKPPRQLQPLRYQVRCLLHSRVVVDATTIGVPAMTAQVSVVPIVHRADAASTLCAFHPAPRVLRACGLHAQDAHEGDRAAA
jgi:hypothetical protein